MTVCRYPGDRLRKLVNRKSNAERRAGCYACRNVHVNLSKRFGRGSNCAKRKAGREGNSWAAFICKDILNPPITAAISAEREASRRQASEELFNPLIMAAAAATPSLPASLG
jgi:hypothetical protein